MLRSYKFRLCPTAAQEQKLAFALGACCELYNAALQERRDAYRVAGKSITRFAQHAELPAVRSARPELGYVYAMVLYDVLDRVDRAFRAFFRRCKRGEKPGYPRFRRRRRYDSMTYKCGAGFRIHGKRLHLAKIGHIKAVFWRGLAGVAIKTVTVKREADGWYAVLSCDVPLPPALPSTGRAVGVDLGLKSLVATSTGATVEPSWALAEADTKLVRLQRVIARRQNSSARRRTAARALAVAHQRVSRQRKAHLDNVVAALIRENDLVVVEDLNVAGLARSRLTKSVHNASWGYLLSKLDSKAEEAGRRVVRVDPRGTSQTCPGCGKIEPKPLAQREHRCVCGLELDRDVAAAQVILDRGLRLLRGEEGQQASSVKREVRPGLTA